MGAFFMPAAGSQWELAGLAKNRPDFFYLQIIDINEIMCYNPNKKFKEGACPFLL